jgi:prophage regulatory protein
MDARQKAEDRNLRNRDLDVITGLSRTTRWRLEREGKFPARRKLSSMAVGWLKSEIDAWLVDNRLAA